VSSDLMHQVGEQASRPDPWPLYAQLRQDRVVQLDEHSYAVGRYDDVLALLHDPRVSSDPHTLTDPGDRQDIPAFINQDPPGHDRLRRVATRFYGPPDSPGLVTGQEPEIRRQIDLLIGAFPQSGQVDVVDSFAYPLPVGVICRLLGVPPADEPQFRVWATEVVGGADAANLEDREEAVKQRDEGMLGLVGYLGDLVKKHRGSPDGSMLSGLANDHEPDAMSDLDLLATSGLLLLAGHETTVNLIANGTLTLLRNPGALARLRREPAWVIPLVEELLRLEPPVQYLPNRAALQDITIDGTTIPKGAKLTLLLAAANRDPDRFPDPDRFDPDRPDNQHLGLGSGLHYCFGAPLARLEVHLALTALARRLDNPRLVQDPPPYRPSPVLRGPVHLPVAYDQVLPTAPDAAPAS
jgi:cytochrome P450